MQIESEEHYNKAKNHLAGKPNAFKSEEFLVLESEVKRVLDTAQDSEKALVFITLGALSLGSSDIHFDMRETEIQLRFRIDGDLVDVFSFTPAQYKLVLERLKYKSDLKLNITTIPQDGKYRIQDEMRKIDVRVSTLPVKIGENVVCRILDSSNKVPTIEELGFIWGAKRHIERSMKKKNGMILVTGPTGSGKTTTLYSMLSTLNTPDKKIITLEDPIEYEMAGIVQSEVNEKNGYTFQTGLRALVRQDPDIIMIGEIRDLETASIAAQASLTGHLVLATLHTKSAAETLERLINIGVPPYILSTAIDVIIAQRLVKRNCPHCVQQEDATNEQNEIIKWMMKDIGIAAVHKAMSSGFKLFRGAGCEKCGYSGFKGRLGVYEVLGFNDNIRTLIRDGASPSAILEEARKQDMILMREDGVLKAMRGKTTIEELFRVVE